jgi:3-deoxy-D-manno-octulosonate 8-phosphate phosphatase (KDO 8-P phosphatase)
MIFEAFKKIKAVVLDVDGVLTDGHLLVNEQGDQLRTFYVRDGYALQLSIRQGIPIMVITGGRSEGVRQRLAGLGVLDIAMGIHDKVAVLRDWCTQKGLSPEEVAYIGDDMPDLEVMQMVGLPICPSDAIPEIKAISQYVTSAPGGKGAVREVLELMLKWQNKWPQHSEVRSI